MRELHFSSRHLNSRTDFKQLREAEQLFLFQKELLETSNDNQTYTYRPIRDIFYTSKA